MTRRLTLLTRGKCLKSLKMFFSLKNLVPNSYKSSNIYKSRLDNFFTTWPWSKYRVLKSILKTNYAVEFQLGMNFTCFLSIIKIKPFLRLFGKKFSSKSYFCSGSGTFSAKHPFLQFFDSPIQKHPLYFPPKNQFLLHFYY